MRVERISKEQMLQAVSDQSEGFLLLESSQLEEADYDARLASNKGELPVQKSARDLIDDVDSFTIDTLLWEDTIFNEFKEAGPILSHYHQGSCLPETILSTWGDWHIGVLIEATSRKNLVDHLRSILMVNMPNDGEVRYRFQETRKLAGIINSLSDDDRISQFLGPIKTMHWQQNCGPEKVYQKIENPNVKETNHPAGWFSFTQDETSEIRKSNVAWFKRGLLNSIVHDIQAENSKTHRLNRYTPNELEKIIEQGYEAAIRNNISSQKAISFYVHTHLFYPEFMTDSVTSQIMNHETWLESRKIRTLKTMLKDHVEHSNVYAS